MMELLRSQALGILSEHHPEAAVEIQNLQSLLSEQPLDPSLLQLCSDYFDSALSKRPWTPPDSMTALQQACLDVCEQFMTSVSNVTDEQIAALSDHLNPDQLYNLMYGIYLIESSKRLELMLERTLQ